MEALAHNEQILVAVGEAHDPVNPYQQSAAVWVSNDGTSWRRTAR
jgi:hypothetical protein